jgi:hypothetical protein
VLAQSPFTVLARSWDRVLLLQQARLLLVRHHHLVAIHTRTSVSIACATAKHDTQLVSANLKMASMLSSISAIRSSVSLPSVFAFDSANLRTSPFDTVPLERRSLSSSRGHWHSFTCHRCRRDQSPTERSRRTSGLSRAAQTRSIRQTE